MAAERVRRAGASDSPRSRPCPRPLGGERWRWAEAELGSALHARALSTWRRAAACAAKDRAQHGSNPWAAGLTLLI